MARTTDPALRNQTVYSVFVRNHSTEGNFRALTADLDRIAGLGISVLWLMPVHPIGVENRKGSAGSPYAISDYRGINPEYGDLDDFTDLVRETHLRGLKIIIDIVYNHTSPDSLLRKVHPVWFWRRPDGGFGNRVGEWWDVIDLDYGSRGLWDYQIESLKGWLYHGVDGFRCDVASLIPLPFWIEARDACASVNPDTIWIAETVESDFINEVRRLGYDCMTDAEALRAFDLSYEYDVYPDWCTAADGKTDVGRYIARLRLQEASLSDTDLKLRFIENHDKERAAARLAQGVPLKTWTAWSLFIKGTALVYAGGEYGVNHKPDLFNPDPLNWAAEKSGEGLAHCAFLKKLIEIKKAGIVRDGFFWYPEAPGGYIAGAYERRSPDGRLTGLRLGVFRVSGRNEALWDLRPLWPELGERDVMTDQVEGQTSVIRDHTLKLPAGSGPLILDWGLTS
jgi:glycosidase